MSESGERSSGGRLKYAQLSQVNVFRFWSKTCELE